MAKVCLIRPAEGVSPGALTATGPTRAAGRSVPGGRLQRALEGLLGIRRLYGGG